MEKADFLEKVKEIGTCEDDATRRSLLADLQEGVSADYDAFTESSSKNEELTAEVTRLQEHNMKLFLQVGSPAGGNTPPDNPPEVKEKRKFEDLFNEKGRLK